MRKKVWCFLTIVFLITASLFLGLSFIGKSVASNGNIMTEADYWRVMNATYEGYLNPRWDAQKKLYLDENNNFAWLKANQAMLLFHLMRGLSDYAYPEDLERARSLIDNLISDFNLVKQYNDVYYGDGANKKFKLSLTRSPGGRSSVRSVSQAEAESSRTIKTPSPSTIQVRINGALQKEGQDYKVLSKTSIYGDKYVEFYSAPPKSSKININYQNLKQFHVVVGEVEALSHNAWNYQTSEALFYAWKYSVPLNLTSTQVTGIKKAITTLADYTDNFNIVYNQDGLAWSSGVLRFAYEITRDSKHSGRWNEIMDTTLKALNKTRGTNKLADMDPDFSLNYNPSSEESELAWDCLEYSNIVLRSLQDIKFFRDESLYDFYQDPKIRYLLGLRQHDLGNYMLNGYPNWDTGYGRYRQFVSQYWPYSLYSLKAIILTPDLNQQGEDHQYARYLWDQAVSTFEIMDEHNSDPADGAISANPFGVRPALSVPHYDNNKITANADFLGQTALMVQENKMLEVSPKVPRNVWRWDWKQQKFAISTPFYSTSIVGMNNGYAKKSGAKLGFPYAGFEMTTLLSPKNLPWLITKPATFDSSLGFRVKDYSTNKILLDTWNSLLDKQSSPLSSRPLPALKVTESPQGDLSDLEEYDFRKFNLEFDKVTIEGQKFFDDYRYLFRNRHVFTSDGILVDEGIVAYEKHFDLMEVSKNFPASRFVERVVVTDIQGQEHLIWERDSGFSDSFGELQRAKYIHYISSDSGLLIIPRVVEAGFPSSIKVASESITDDYNIALRHIYYKLQSGIPLEDLRFSVYLTFTDGSREDAETNYLLYQENFPPTLELRQPEEGEVIYSRTKIIADEIGLSASSPVEFYLDDKVIGLDSTPPYSIWLEPGAYQEGTHRLKVKTEASSGEVFENEISIQVKHLSPLNFPHIADSKNWISYVSLANAAEGRNQFSWDFFDKGGTLSQNLNFTSFPGAKFSKYLSEEGTSEGSLHIESEQPAVGYLAQRNFSQTMLGIMPSVAKEKASTTLYYPHVVDGGKYWRSYISLKNVSSYSAEVTLNFYDEAGGLQKVVPGVSIPAGGKYGNYPEAIYGGPFSGSITVESTQPLLGYFGQRNLARTMMGIMPAVSDNQASTHLNNPHVVSEDTLWKSYLSLKNVTSRSASVALKLYDNAGNLKKTVSGILIPPQGKYSDYVRNIYGGDFTGSIQVESDKPLAGYFGQRDGRKPMLGIMPSPAEEETSTTLYYPHVADDGTYWATYLGLKNTSETSAASVTFKFYSNSGTLLKIVSGISIPPRGKYGNYARSIYGAPFGSGSVKIESDQLLVGYMGQRNGSMTIMGLLEAQPFP